MSKIKTNKKINLRKRGFGILEVLLASLVVIIVLGSLVFLARNSILNVTYRAQHSQATFLAQEGIEAVRQIRDTNYLDDDPSTKWNTLAFGDRGAISIADMKDKNYKIDLDSSGDKYALELSGSDSDVIPIEGTDFERKINVRLINKDEENIFSGETDLLENAYVVDCIVTWISTRGSQAEVKITEMMTNSRQGL